MSHDDRDIEIIMLKRNILEYLNKRYWTENANCLFFDSMSCEMIAAELVKYFALDYCEVLEDGENGAEVISESKQQSTEVVETTKEDFMPVVNTTSKGGWVTTTTDYSKRLKFNF